MKIREEYVLQNIAGKWIVFDTNAKSVNFNKILALNESGRFLFGKLEEGADREMLVSALMDEFGIDRALAEKDTDKFVQELMALGCVEDA